MNPNKIGKLIKNKRIEKGLTQNELASKLNITDKAISKWESGNGIPDISIIKQLSNELGITAEELLDGEEKLNNKIKYKTSYINIKSKKTETFEKILKNIITYIVTFVIVSTIFTLLSFSIKNIDVSYSYSNNNDEKKEFDKKVKQADENLKLIETKKSNVFSDSDKEILVKNLKNVRNAVNIIKKDDTFKGKENINKYELFKYYKQVGTNFEDFVGYMSNIHKILKKYNFEDENDFFWDSDVKTYFKKYQNEVIETLNYLTEINAPSFRYDFLTVSYDLNNSTEVISYSYEIENIYLEMTKVILNRGDFNE